MHEIAISQSILDTLEVQLEKDQPEQVLEVHLKIGVLSCVDPSTLTNVFGYMKQDTRFRNCRLHIELVDVLARCAECAANFKVENYRFICPVCEKPSQEVVEGNELAIYKIILEEPSYAQINE